jgi:ABC-2 type transport system ATP-binding protein
MSAAITLEALTKYYGRTRGIEDLDLAVEEGEIFGFLGPNGAGKSTTISTILDFIRPTSGRATVLGMDSRRDSISIHRQVGYLSGEPAMYDRMTGGELLSYLAALRGVDASSEIRSLAERLDLDPGKRIRSYSSGNRQKIGLIQAFMHRPRLLILDEPTNGLDPIVQHEFYALLEEVKADGRTVFLSSHILPEVERITDRAGIIRKGRLMVVAGIDDLKSRAKRRIELTFAEAVDPAVFLALESVHAATGAGRTVTVTAVGSVDQVLKTAARYRVDNIVSHEGDLESAFLAYYREDDSAS